MTSAPAFRFQRMVDLSRRLVPGAERHPWTSYEARVESIVAEPETAPAEGSWYVVTHLALAGHAGTHVEAPWHAMREGADVGAIAVDVFFGEAAVLDLSDVAWSRETSPAVVRSAADAAGGLRPGDIALLRFDWDRRSPREGPQPPYLAPEAMRWLVESGIKLLGIDSPGLEVPGHRGLVNHSILFERGIPLIESLTKLDELRRRVYLFAQPLPLAGADACPLRVLAFEG